MVLNQCEVKTAIAILTGIDEENIVVTPFISQTYDMQTANPNTLYYGVLNYDEMELITYKAESTTRRDNDTNPWLFRNVNSNSAHNQFFGYKITCSTNTFF